MSYYHVIYAVFLSFLALACIVVTTQLPKYKHTPLKLAPALLWLVFISEGIGFLYGKYVSFDNGWIYNITNILFFALFYLMMDKYLVTFKLKKITRILCILSIAFYCFRFLTAETFNVRLSLAHCIAVLTLLITCIAYIIQLLRSNQSFYFREHPEFIFIGGNLILNLVYAPIYVSSDLNIHIFSDAFYTYVSSIHSYVYMAINLLFIIGFLWAKKARL